jgi:hypothetical protein
MEDAMRNSKIQFIRSQGFPDPHPGDQLYSALMLQPRIVGAVTVIGVLLQTPWLLLALSAALGWSALVPTRSPFDAIYNYVVARPRGLAPLGTAPAPRRFAAGLAAILTLAIGVALLTEARSTARVLEALLAAAVAAVVFGRSCAGAALYEVLRRRWSSGGRACSAAPLKAIARIPSGHRLLRRRYSRHGSVIFCFPFPSPPCLFSDPHPPAPPA